ncbi:hypothetical protein JRQ81_017063 [Phrynocephalus forsythii]|uniref:Meiosis 1 arrest protein n=1 Tax=Phrynocephalus forsythii TaxID=171643 RepID=A0A9Q0XWQ7_9SAUR|nr:hypothetical protein JRQ81_017063 [Phrynocephalus forsythii]
MSSRRWGEAPPASNSTAPPVPVAIHSLPLPPPRILVVDVHAPHWAHTCHKLCDALENVFSLACALAGPPRIPLFSLYVVHGQQECLLPFLPVRGGFARLQSCIAELRALPTEGTFQPPQGQSPVAQAVRDGLQQFKQYTGRGMAGASWSNGTMEITVLTSQGGPEVARQLEAGLQKLDLVHLRQLQVVEISKAGFQEPPEAGGGEGAALSISSSGGSSSGSGTVLGPEVALQTVENDTVALEMLFKAWFHDHNGDREHLHLLLPAGTLGCPGPLGASLECVKCDLQERLLGPPLLLAAAARHGSPAGANDGATGCLWAAPTQGGLAPRKLRVLRALRATGLCASLLFGPSLVVLPTSCWQLAWDELEANQQRFQALCHSLWAREWLLLAKDEEPSGGPGPVWSPLNAALQVLLPSESGSLLLRSVATRELLLPCSFPAAPAAPPEAALRSMEIILSGLQVETAYDPLATAGHLYQGLRRSLGWPRPSRPQRPAERHWPRQPASRGQASKVRATVAPLRMVLSPANPSEAVFSLHSSPEEEFQETSK